jgi:hypothetical protein
VLTTIERLLALVWSVADTELRVLTALSQADRKRPRECGLASTGRTEQLDYHASLPIIGSREDARFRA